MRWYTSRLVVKRSWDMVSTHGEKRKDGEPLASLERSRADRSVGDVPRAAPDAAGLSRLTVRFRTD
ncbi:hypothetical protein MFU01_51570 [Myxococcus fulvus]|uniref:Uncharacterized protein n=1 Tax=Myxococcus fulvus TaxID=33 RepID=A0A511T7H8_MYXFU|nr:hypothetical protein MFU01_51570 [Myxococcus fulvus]